jgi:hypothetical protein
MTIKEAKKLEHFFCEGCSHQNGKRAGNTNNTSGETEEKVIINHSMQYFIMLCCVPTKYNNYLTLYFT